MPSGLALLVVVLALVALVPTRRLFHRGWGAGRLAAYWIGLTVLGLLVAELRGPARFLVPAYVVAFGAPFVTFRAGLDRLLGREPQATVRPASIRRVGPADDAPADPPTDHRSDGTGSPDA